MGKERIGEVLGVFKFSEASNKRLEFGIQTNHGFTKKFKG